ncbi:MAG TPA: lipid A biosynthesis acyltransferase [Vitreimonas sp.]|uniref:lysophospholipid acyltransferase family protein n=1 Tax=Vitreimonas sp. TaxID=3069702 RepID=UPI002D46CBC1|nr:lipid A biosynthesis acyltransferase [Vitreimonas sp.]HYD87238.1 lipid A biosynthesis acyltransferase [Vitreimonas sp.]
MAKPKPLNFMFRLEALAWNAYVGGLGALGLERASRWGGAIVPTVAPLSSAWKTALRNIRMCFPNESDAWHREVRKESFQELGRMTGEFPHMDKFLEQYRRGELVFEGKEIVEATLGKGAVFIGGHFTDWEVTSLCLAQTDPTCHFTYRPANNPIIDKYIVETRAAFGLGLQAAKGKEGGMGLLRSLKKGRSVALMNDQKYNMGLSVPLFGYECMTADGPTRLALKFKVPLIPITGRRIDGVKFVARAYEPIPLDYDKPDEETNVYAGVKRVNEFMEARIREAPGQWFWSHRRWPKEAWAKAGVM